MSKDLDEDFSKHFVDTGLHDFMTPDFEVGTIVALGINKQSDPIILDFGFGIRF